MKREEVDVRKTEGREGAATGLDAKLFSSTYKYSEEKLSSETVTTGMDF